MTRAGFLYVAAFVLSAAVASSAAGGSATGVAPAAAVEVTGPLTTGGTVAMRNVESDLLDAEQRVLEEPANVRAQLRRSNLVYLRARVTGDIDETARALAMTDACVREHPTSADARLLRAVQLQTLHRFAASRDDLKRARELGADDAKVAGLERELDWNSGLAGPAAKAIREEAALRPTMASFMRLARLEHDLGSYALAETHYARALEMVDGKDPVPVAMLEVQRGVNLADAGRIEEAVATLRNAVARLPSYAAAREHLAETLHRMGRDDEALAIYEQLTRSSRDPEFAGALAALHRQHGRIAEADALRARATQRYEALLVSYPEAMAWHAAEFFAGEGRDRERARALLRTNAELRPTIESLEALARLERGAGDRARADELIARAESIRAAARE